MYFSGAYVMMKGNYQKTYSFIDSSHWLFLFFLFFKFLSSGFSQPVAVIPWYSSNALCPSDDIQLSTWGSTDTLRLYWGDGDSLTDNQGFSFAPSHHYSKKGNYQIILVAYEHGATDTARLDVTVYSTVRYEHSLIDNCITDNGFTVQFADSSSGVGIPNSTRLWDFGDGTSDTAKNPLHAFYLPGTYVVSMTHDHDTIQLLPFVRECTSAYYDTIIVSADVNIVTGITANEGCPCNNYSFIASGNADIWTWDFGDGNATSGTSSTVAHQYQNPGQYFVSVTGKNSLTGCIYTKEISLAVCKTDMDTSSRSNYRWYFGGARFLNVFPYNLVLTNDAAGIDFNTTPPTPLLDGKIESSEAASTVSDPLTGDLLFYTNGNKVWDKNHNVMTNGTGLYGALSAAQGSLIVPYPGNRNKYYLFTADGGPHDGTGKGYYYSVVDLSVGSTGSVITKNTPLFTGPCPVVAGVPEAVNHEALSGTVKHPGDCQRNAEYWVVIPSCKDTFRSYLITDAGISPPVISVHPNSAYSVSSYSAFSPNGKKYAIAEYYGTTSDIRLWDFNLNTGKLENTINIPIRPYAYGLCFSPDGSLLYAEDTTFWQFDLTSMNPFQNKVNLTRQTTVDGMYLGPDNKIYIAGYNNNSLATINSPNTKGSGCNVQQNSFPLNGKISKSGLQNIISLRARDTLDYAVDFTIDTTACSLTVNFLNPDCKYIPDNLITKWIYGDGTIITYPSLQYASHTYAEGGTYQVMLIVEHPCFSIDTVKKNFILDALPDLDVTSDMGICLGGSLPLAATGADHYSWSPFFGLNSSTGSNVMAMPTSDMTYYVTGTNDNGCVDLDSVSVSIVADLSITLGTDVFICDGASTILSVLSNASASYSWNPVIGLNSASGNTVVANPNTTTIYNVTAISGICTAIDSIVVRVNPLPVAGFSNTTVSGCAPWCVTFTNNTLGSLSCIWNFGDGNFSSSCDTAINCYSIPGLYTVSLMVDDTNGCKDSITNSNYVQVYSVPTALFSATPASTKIFDPINFTDESLGSPLSWEWIFGDAQNSFSVDQFPHFSYSDTGTYMVQLIVTDINNCKDSTSHNVYIGSDYAFFVNNSFTPNGDGLNDIFLPRGISIDVNEYQMIVFDRWGNIVFQTTDLNEGWNGKIQKNNAVDALEEIYMYRITTKDQYKRSYSYMGHIILIR